MQFIFAAKILKLFISVIALGDEVKERQKVNTVYLLNTNISFYLQNVFIIKVLLNPFNKRRNFI